MTEQRWLVVAGIVCATTACGSEDPPRSDPGRSGASGAGASGGAGATGGSGASAGAGGSAGSELGWQSLVTGSWSVAPGSEDYYCVRKTLDRDVWIDAFESINPTGTHHTVLTFGEPSGPDGLVPCHSFDNHPTMIFGSGVGTNPFEFPAGVAVRLRAGQQLLLNLHLFNTSGAELRGESGTRARLVQPTSTLREAESILAGTLSVSLPPQRTTTTHGTCTITSSGTIFGVQPHMHQLGTHMKVVASTARGDVLLHDAAYDFGEQPIYSIEPLELAVGDKLEVDCTHANTTNAPVGWGESSTAEMCHAGVYRYPSAGAGYFFCQR